MRVPHPAPLRPRASALLLARLRARPTRFAAEARGSVSVETLLILPILFWALVATIVFFDGFRARNQTQLAAQTVADLLSRETERFTIGYLEGMNDVFDFIAESRFPTRLRISSVIWSSADERNRLQWSYGTRGLQPLPDDTFLYLQNDDYAGLIASFGEDDSYSFAAAINAAPRRDLADRIPPVLPGEALILVESFALWSPFYDVGVNRIRFNPVVVTRPRFSPWVNLEGVDPLVPEVDYEVEFAGYVPGNESLPNPTQPGPVDPNQPVPVDPTQPVPVDPTQPTPPAPPPAPPGTVHQTFDDGVTTGWSSSTITANATVSAFLGPFGGATYNTPLTYTANLGANPPPRVRITFDLLIIDSWDGTMPPWAHPEGESLTLMINGSPVSLHHFQGDGQGYYMGNRFGRALVNGRWVVVNMNLVRSGTNFHGSSWTDQIWRVYVDYDLPPSTFTLGLSARLDEDISNESFGIDNFRVTHETGTAHLQPLPTQSLLGADPLTRFPVYGGCPDVNLTTVWFHPRNDHLSTPLEFNVRGRGNTNIGNCPGVAGQRHTHASPSFALGYDNQGRSGPGNHLRIRANDGNNGQTCDTTLLVRDPTGQWWYNDDMPGQGWNPGLNIVNPPSGTYYVWVGLYGTSACTTRAIIERY